MSYEIEYQKKAYKAQNSYGDEVYFTFIMTSSNNIDPRTPRPMFFANGQGYEIIQQACKFAARCESGILKPNNRDCSPESYIRRWRQVLKDATPLEQFASNNPFFGLKLTMNKDVLRTYLEIEPAQSCPTRCRWDRVKELLQGLSLEESRWFDEEHTSVFIRVKNYSDVERATALFHLLKEAKATRWNIEIIF